MIENKRVVIERKNRFDMGWAIVRPHTLPRGERWSAELNPSYVVKRITTAKRVNLVLCDRCLSRAVIEELDWVGKYIDINLIAKSRDTVSYYSKQLELKSTAIDPSLNLNYMAIEGNEPLYCLIRNGYVEVDSTINDEYFGEGAGNCGTCVLSNLSRAYVVAESFGKIDFELLDSLRGVCKMVLCAIPKEAYGKDVYLRCRELGVGLVLAEASFNGAVAVNGEDERYLIHKSSLGGLFGERISSRDTLFLDAYECLFLDEICDYVDIPQKSFLWLDGEVRALDIKPTLTVSSVVELRDMAAFVNEEFDRSSVEEHNKYAYKARCVEYVFELVPPVLPTSPRCATVYSELLGALEKWKRLDRVPFDKLASLIVELTGSEANGICLGFGRFGYWTGWLCDAIGGFDYTDFSARLAELSAFLGELLNGLEGCLTEAYGALLSSGESRKCENIDVEIEGYRRIVAEKQALVDQGVSVTSNKRSIDRLEEKIKDLLAIKARFEKGNGDRVENALLEFKERCKNYLRGTHTEEVREGSLRAIVKTGDESRTQTLEAFVRDNLCTIRELLSEHLSLVEAMLAVEVPDNYVIYESNGRRMIAINDVDEYYSTKEICKKYGLCCVARRTK